MTQQTNAKPLVSLNRRKLTQVVWTTPVITAITLPSHALTTAAFASTTRACTAVGTWDAQGAADENGETAAFSFVLNADGSAKADNTSLPPIRWSESNGTVSLVMQDPNPDNSDFVTLVGVMSPDCNFLTAGSLSASVDGVAQQVGTWTATRRL